MAVTGRNGMRLEVGKLEMIERVCGLNPCHGRATIERWAQHWPEDVTPLWLLTHAQRGPERVPAEERVWLAFRLHTLDVIRPAVQGIVRRSVCDHTATVVDACGMRDCAARLRALRGSELHALHKEVVAVRSESMKTARIAAAAAAYAADVARIATTVENMASAAPSAVVQAALDRLAICAVHVACDCARATWTPGSGVEFDKATASAWLVEREQQVDDLADAIVSAQVQGAERA